MRVRSQVNNGKVKSTKDNTYRKLHKHVTDQLSTASVVYLTFTSVNSTFDLEQNLWHTRVWSP